MYICTSYCRENCIQTLSCACTHANHGVQGDNVVLFEKEACYNSFPVEENVAYTSRKYIAGFATYLSIFGLMCYLNWLTLYIKCKVQKPSIRERKDRHMKERDRKRAKETEAASPVWLHVSLQSSVALEWATQLSPLILPQSRTPIPLRENTSPLGYTHTAVVTTGHCLHTHTDSWWRVDFYQDENEAFYILQC